MSSACYRKEHAMNTIKYILAIMLIALPALAYEVPEDAVIKVYTKDGKQIGKMSRSEYKVVRLASAVECPQQDEESLPAPDQDDIQFAEKKNEVILHGGVGYTGISAVSYSTARLSISENLGAVVGITYCRNIDELGLCGSVLSNSTGLLGVKMGF